MKNDTGKIDPSSKDFFEDKYRQNPDPWNFASSPYELGRYDSMFNLLKGERYPRAFEPGCSVGVFTAHLASICDRVDETPDDTRAARIRARTVRHLGEQASTDILRRLPRAYGPYPLAFDHEIARHYQQLDLYLRQWHAERDLEALGHDVATAPLAFPNTSHLRS